MQHHLNFLEDVAVITLNGKLVAGVGDEILAQNIGRALDEGYRNIVLNLEGVSYIDSSGVGEIASGLQRTRALGARLVTTAMGGRVERVLQLSQVLPLLEVHENEAAAVQALRAADSTESAAD